ncbi:ABC transporter A family member 12 [Camellia lanceoleosa]|uniref:ABC transporter A family member 12 n=1 Tax=Camellia lanceoleosa TaxID=1840588 RepID=A0ACC0F2K7_9ERIC|nr:ABC transporter A family member 12 [Camellia lanceoleosa]
MDENGIKSLVDVLDLVFSALREKVLNNLKNHAAPETRATPRQPWLRGWDDFKKGRSNLLREESENEDHDEDMVVDATKQSDEVARALVAADALGKASLSTTSVPFQDIEDSLQELDMEHYDEKDDGVELIGTGIGDAYYPNSQHCCGLCYPHSLSVWFLFLGNNFVTHIPIYASHIDIFGLREATKAKNHDENAWAWRRPLLDDYLCLFSCHIFGLHVMFCVIWLSYRLKFFTLNDYSIQFVFYFIYVNLQISLAFLVASIFANVKTAAVVGYIMVFGSGLLGGFLFQCFVEDTSFQSIQVSFDGH